MAGPWVSLGGSVGGPGWISKTIMFEGPQDGRVAFPSSARAGSGSGGGTPRTPGLARAELAAFVNRFAARHFAFRSVFASLHSAFASLDFAFHFTSSFASNRIEFRTQRADRVGGYMYIFPKH